MRMRIGLVVALVALGCSDAGVQSLHSKLGLVCPASGPTLGAPACATIDFGDVQIGTEATRTVHATNQGNAALKVTASGWENGSDSSFSASAPPKSLNAEESGDFQIAFAPVVAGEKHGTFFIADTGVASEQLTVLVKGNGVGTPKPALDATSIDFGDVMKETTATKTLHVTNHGNLALTLVSAAIADGGNEFAIDTGSVTSVAPGATDALGVSYTPTDPGIDTSSAIIVTAPEGDSAAADQTQLTVALTGRSMPHLTVSPTSIDFSMLSYGSRATHPIALVNDGKADLSLTSVVLKAGSSSAFTVTAPPSMPATIVPGDSAVATVLYQPVSSSVESPDTGEVDIASSDPTNPTVAVPLNGICSDCVGHYDSGCNGAYPHRLWPISSDVTQGYCTGGSKTYPATGPDSADWFDYIDCGHQRDFGTTAAKPIEITTWADGCTQPGDVLWHIYYDLQENGATTATVGPFDNRCASNGTSAFTNVQDYTPTTSDLKMLEKPTTQGEGFYFKVCSQ